MPLDNDNFFIFIRTWFFSRNRMFGWKHCLKVQIWYIGYFHFLLVHAQSHNTICQGYVSCGILVSGIQARGEVRSTWRTWRCFPVVQLRCALILREFNQIFTACLFKGSQKQSFFLQTLLFTAFLVTVLKILTYALGSTWSSVSSEYEHGPQLMQPWWEAGLAKGRKVEGDLHNVT